MKTQQCIRCNRNYRILTNKEICYHCHINKYGSSPDEKQFGNNPLKEK